MARRVSRALFADLPETWEAFCRQLILKAVLTAAIAFVVGLILYVP